MRRLLLLGAFLCCSVPVLAQVSVESNVDVVSQYRWRSSVIAPRPALQPSVTAGWRGLSVDLWGSAVLHDRAAYGEADEVDVTVDYTHSFDDRVEVSTGLIGYATPHVEEFTLRDHATLEGYVGVAATSLPLSPSATVYYDVNLGHAAFVEAGLAPSLTIAGRRFETSLTTGFDGGQFGNARGFSFVDASLGTQMVLGSFFVTPAVTLVRTLRAAPEQRTLVLFSCSVGI